MEVPGPAARCALAGHLPQQIELITASDGRLRIGRHAELPPLVA
jgi:hypothetical protein